MSASLAVPQLYSEPPPIPYAALGPGRPVRLRAYSGASSTTDAPSIVTLAESMLLRRRHQNWLYLGGLLVAVLLVATLLRFKVGSSSAGSAAALMTPAPASVAPSNRAIALDTNPSHSQGASIPLTQPVAPAAEAATAGDKVALSDSASNRALTKADPLVAKLEHQGNAKSNHAAPKQDTKAFVLASGVAKSVAVNAAASVPQPAPLASQTVENTIGLSRNRATQGTP